VFLDAECACYGDPAFDLAFCLNHLILKCLVQRARCEAYLASFILLSESYFNYVSWEQRDPLEARTASLLPGLLLARVDGKSPVEYLTREEDKALVRVVAARFLRNAPKRLSEFAGTWRCILMGQDPEKTRN
jgi:hypothetical protein